MFKRMIREAKERNRMLTELPWEELKNREAANSRKQAIPPVVYQTWNNKYFGKTHRRAMEKFRDLNPDLSFTLFLESDVDRYMEEHWSDKKIYEIFKGCMFGPIRADIFRYCLLHERGGYYFDISRGCSAPLASIHRPEATALISFDSEDCLVFPKQDVAVLLKHPEKYVLQWGLGFAPGHPILATVIDSICEHYGFFKNREFRNPKAAIQTFTGRGMFTRSVRESASALGPLTIQAGVEFNGAGQLVLPGSDFRHVAVPDYSNAVDSVIIS